MKTCSRASEDRQLITGLGVILFIGLAVGHCTGVGVARRRLMSILALSFSLISMNEINPPPGISYISPGDSFATSSDSSYSYPSFLVVIHNWFPPSLVPLLKPTFLLKNT